MVDSVENETEETICSTDSAIAGTQFDAFLLDKELGSLKVPVQHLTLASDKKRVRPLDSDYAMKIVRATKESTINLAFPEAIGNVDTDIDDLSSIKEKIISGELVVEIIDGNHKTYAMQTLLEEFPDVERFQSR